MKSKTVVELAKSWLCGGYETADQHETQQYACKFASYILAKQQTDDCKKTEAKRDEWKTGKCGECGYVASSELNKDYCIKHMVNIIEDESGSPEACPDFVRR